jgi:hypothetical protein
VHPNGLELVTVKTGMGGRYGNKGAILSREQPVPPFMIELGSCHRRAPRCTACRRVSASERLGRACRATGDRRKSIFVKSAEATRLRDVALVTVKTGMGGRYGNKGAILSRERRPIMSPTCTTVYGVSAGKCIRTAWTSLSCHWR